MGIASSDKNTIRKMSEIEAVIYDRFLQKSPPTRRLRWPNESPNEAERIKGDFTDIYSVPSH